VQLPPLELSMGPDETDADRQVRVRLEMRGDIVLGTPKATAPMRPLSGAGSRPVMDPSQLVVSLLSDQMQQVDRIKGMRAANHALEVFGVLLKPILSIEETKALASKLGSHGVLSIKALSELTLAALMDKDKYALPERAATQVLAAAAAAQAAAHVAASTPAVAARGYAGTTKGTQLVQQAGPLNVGATQYSVPYGESALMSPSAPPPSSGRRWRFRTPKGSKDPQNSGTGTGGTGGGDDGSASARSGGNSSRVGRLLGSGRRAERATPRAAPTGSEQQGHGHEQVSQVV
jgi:hypothetical protein